MACVQLAWGAQSACHLAIEAARQLGTEQLELRAHLGEPRLGLKPHLHLVRVGLLLQHRLHLGALAVAREAQGEIIPRGRMITQTIFHERAQLLSSAADVAAQLECDPMHGRIDLGAVGFEGKHRLHF